MIQGGDPTGSGGGTAGFAFKDEVTEFDKSGILAMANSGPAKPLNFITHKDTPWLNGKLLFLAMLRV
jgi:cyclophilin family peptidyl-prolyl cis-trans isomerase